jgi:histidinol-phosphate aminotransferase
MTPQSFPRGDYGSFEPYDPGRSPVEVDLSDNTNLWGPHPGAMDVVRRSPPEALARYPSVYATRLKEAVARKFGIPTENVTTGCGSDDLLDSAFRASAVPPARMTFPDPTFSMVGVFARMNGMEPHPVPWAQAMQDPQALLSVDPDLVYLCRPNNPTGLSATRKWLLELLDAAGENGPLVVLDEAYADFATDHFLPEAAASQRLLVLRTLSKLYGLAGLRVGFGIASKSVIQEVEKSRGPYKVAQVSETAAVSALDDTSGWMERILAETLENRERLRRELVTRGLPPLPSQANFLLIPLGPGVGQATPDGQARWGLGARMVNAALKERGVAVRPFAALPGIGDALRVSVGPWPLMARFLDALDAVLQGGRGPR